MYNINLSAYLGYKALLSWSAFKAPHCTTSLYQISPCMCLYILTVWGVSENNRNKPEFLSQFNRNKPGLLGLRICAWYQEQC